LVPWRGQEAPERQGLTENLYVQGYLAYWDALRQQHPGMLIDSCASGGRRNDLETLRRAVPLLRSDFQAPVYNPKPPDIDSGNQCHTYGLSLWVPYYGTGVSCEDVYSVRSHLCPALGIGTDLGKPQWPVLRQRLADYRKVADYFYGDYYPLTEYSRAQNVWMAWEFVRPERRDGMIQVFRRVDSPYETARLRMRGLNANARYALTDVDTGRTRVENGRDLTNDGLRMTMPVARTAALLTFLELR
jgi:alpha-galactosidase